jgi:hypothetical protein
MPTDLRRRVDIAAAVAAYDGANPNAPLPRNAARLLAVMFLTEDACQRSQEAIAAEGFSRDRLPAMLRPPGARATLFGRWVSRWRVIRTSNAYGSRDPRASWLPSPKIGREHRVKRFKYLLLHQPTRTALWRLHCGDLEQVSKENCF